MKSIFIGIPSLGRIQTQLALNLLAWKSSRKYQVEIYHENGEKPVSSAQNKIIREFLTRDMDYLLLLESDVIPPPNRICPSSSLDLTEFEVDMVNGLCFICERGAPFIGKAAAASRFEEERCLSLGPEELYPPRLIEVDFTGAGCLMVKRKVLESLVVPYFKFEYTENGDKVIISQDYYFSKQVKEKGFQIFIHSGFQCIHEVEVGI